MISVDVDKVVKYNEPTSPNKAVLSLKGLSSDTKPTVTFEDATNKYEIANGSSFFEMDTQEVKFYNESANVWV